MAIIKKENKAQECAVRYADGPMQVLAGPGSGKTYTIVKRIRYLVEERKVPPETILVITFTKAAAKEMQSRFLTEIGNPYSNVHFGTFHSIYYQILIQSGYFQDFSLITEYEKRKIIRGILQRIFPEQSFDQSECAEVLNEISRIKNKEEPIGQYENIMVIYEEYCEMLQYAKKLDFDDMILCCYTLLCKNKKILKEWQQCFSFILVDEFQDINRLQYQILKLLAAPANQLFVVGDDDQSIYGFRGAKPTVMKEFLEDYNNCKQVVLDINYRSTHSIVEASGKVISCNHQRMAKKYYALREGSAVSIASFTNIEEENVFLLEQISSLPTDIAKESAVILRTNYEVSLLAVKCAEKKIAIQVTEKIKDIFSHFISVDIMDYIRFAYQKKTRKRFLNIMNKPMRYISRKSVADVEEEIVEDDLLQYYRGNIDCKDEIRRFFADCGRIAKMSPFFAIHYIRKGMGYDRHLKERTKQGEYDEWMEMADAIQESARNLNTFEEWFELTENYHTLCKQNESNGQIGQKQKLKEGIRLTTMHSAKGLEFHTVFLPYLNEGTLPNKKSKSTEQIEEERRLFYVAMTRAKEKLWLLYTASQKHTPSRFLEPLLK